MDIRIKEKLNEQLNKLGDTKLKALFDGSIFHSCLMSGTDLEPREIFTKYRAQLKQLFPKNFDIFKTVYERDDIVDKLFAFREMAFIEYMGVNLSDWKFLDEYFSDGKTLYDCYGITAGIVRRKHKDVGEIIKMADRYPLASNLFSQVLLGSNDSEAIKYLMKGDGKALDFLIEKIKQSGLEDSNRFKIFSAFLKCHDLKVLDFFTRAVIDNKFTRFKSLKEAFGVSRLIYIVQFTSQEAIDILRSVVDNTYEKYIFGKNGTYRIIAIDALMKYRMDEFETLCERWLSGGDNLIKRCVLYTIGMNISKYPQFIRFIPDCSLELSECAAALGYSYNFSSLYSLSLRDEFVRLHDWLIKLFDSMDKANYHFKMEDGFPIATDLTKHTLVYLLIELAAKSLGRDTVKQLAARFDGFCIEGQALFIEKLGDKSGIDTRKAAIEFLKGDNYSALKVYKDMKIVLTFDEAVRVSDFLKSKKQSVKNKILQEFLKSPDADKICEYLCGAKEEYKTAIGREMKAALAKKTGKSTKAAVPEGSKTAYKEPQKPQVDFGVDIKKEPMEGIDPDLLEKVFMAVVEFVNENKDYEYQPWVCSEKITLGADFQYIDINKSGFDEYPLGDGFRKIFSELSQHELCELYLITLTYEKCENEYIKSHGGKKGALKRYTKLKEKYVSIGEKYLPRLMLAAVDELIEPSGACEYLLKLTLNGAYSTEHYYSRNNLDLNWLMRRASGATDTESLKKLFFISDNYDKLGKSFRLESKAIITAVESGVLPEEYLRYVLTLHSGSVGSLTMRRERNTSYIFHSEFKDERFREFFLKLVDTCVNRELERGTLETPYTTFVKNLHEVYGTEIFMKAIAAIRGLTLVRSDGMYSFGREKNDIISWVLKICRPKANEDYECFKTLVEKYKVTKEELVRAVIYNQNFLSYADKYLGIPGFKSAVLYFAAHLNEGLNEERIEKIKEYSTIDYRDFKDGAFDFDWYEDMIKTVPPKDFKLIYDNAKYITVAGLHKRAQRFFDARNGKITLDEAKSKILETRNKDYCLIYSLIPLGGEKDLEERYAFFGDFLRGSKKFGTQRQLSERRVVDIAFDNLARGAGYEDTSVFIYEMESKDLRVLDMYEGIVVDGYTLKLQAKGERVKIVVTSEKGKEIAKVPSAIVKREEVAEITEYRKTEEKKRIRLKRSLEEAMENGTEFTYNQLIRIMRQPLIRDFFQRLILEKDGEPYFVKDGKIFDLLTEKEAEGGSYRIAHPVTLKNSGKLKEAMKFVISHDIKQPFKQVFREMYILSETERGGTEVLRYKGFNVNLKKAVAALRNRGWGFSEDIGMRKVHYHRNTVSTVFREFDYYYIYDFAADDRELESVMFIGRKDEHIMKLEEVDPIVFSETLRDVDLMIALSANNVYDYELSMSTFEMRRAMIAAILEILDIKNVTFLKENIKIEGYYGTYIVNIKTGFVFKEGKGNLLLKTIDNYDKPLMLNFIDEDPMSADIVTKVMLLADDKKLTDSAILAQICG